MLLVGNDFIAMKKGVFLSVLENNIFRVSFLSKTHEANKFYGKKVVEQNFKIFVTKDEEGQMYSDILSV